MSLSRLRPRASARAGLIFIAISVFLDAIAQSSSFPILPRLAQHLLGGDAAQAARWVGLLEVGVTLPQFIALPVIGMLSDRFGRRPIVLVSVFFIGVELIMNALAPSIGWLLVGRVLVGATCGGQAAAMAYVADVTAPEERTKAFGRMNAAIWAAIVVGPAFGGLLAGVNIRAPFWAAALIALVAAAYGWFVLPESLPPERRAELNWRKANVFGALKLIASRPGLPAMGLICFLLWLAFQANQAVMVLYTLHRYGWTPLIFGGFCSVAALANIGIQSHLAGAVGKRIGERAALFGGIALQAIGVAGCGLAAGPIGFCAASVFVWFGNIAGPAIQSLMSANVAPDEQGRLQAAVGTIDGVGATVAPIVATQLFAWTIAAGRPMSWSGWAMLGAGALTASALGVVALGVRQQRVEAAA